MTLTDSPRALLLLTHCTLGKFTLLWVCFVLVLLKQLPSLCDKLLNESRLVLNFTKLSNMCEFFQQRLAALWCHIGKHRIVIWPDNRIPDIRLFDKFYIRLSGRISGRCYPAGLSGRIAGYLNDIIPFFFQLIWKFFCRLLGPFGLRNDHKVFFN